MSRTPTPTQGLGPLYSFALIFEGSEQAVDPDDRRAIRVRGRVLDGNDRRLTAPEAMLEFLQEDQFARAMSDSSGWYEVVVRKPERTRLRDGRLQAPHFEVCLFAFPVLEQLTTRMYFPDEADANAVDPLLELVSPTARHTLIAQRQDDHLRFDIRLRGTDETVFIVPDAYPSLLDGNELVVQRTSPRIRR